MANTTFTGAVRSESTFKTVSKNSTTGAITEVTTVGDGPVSLSDGNVTLTNATHSGRILLVPDGGQDNTYTLPAPIAGSVFRFVYAGAAADATDAIIVTPANANFYIGGVTLLDTDGDSISSVFSNGSSNTLPPDRRGGRGAQSAANCHAKTSVVASKNIFTPIPMVW